MSVEQLPPDRPNPVLIFILACVVLVVVCLFAWIFIHFNAGGLGMRHHSPQPHSRLLRPAPQLG